MTELEWERSIELLPMLEFLGGKVSLRKFQLFAVACCRQHWGLFAPQPSRQIVKAVEQLADGVGAENALPQPAWPPAGTFPKELGSDVVRSTMTAASRAGAIARVNEPHRWVMAGQVANTVLYSVSLQRGLVTSHNEAFSFESHPDRYRQITLLYDVVGNPFRPVAIDQNWLTPTVVAMAKQIDRAPNFSLMPILADALQDAGCDNEVILDHCRAVDSAHARGCWVIDLLLGKE